MKPLLIILGITGMLVSFSPIMVDGLPVFLVGIVLFVAGLICPSSRPKKKAGRSKRRARQNRAAPAASDRPIIGGTDHAIHKAGIDRAD